MDALFKRLFIFLSVFLAGCATITPPEKPVTFDDLDGWNEQQLASVKPALINSCAKLDKATLSENSPWGSYEKWQELCEELAHTPDRQLKHFFENNFRLKAIPQTSESILTGYYSPVIEGRTQPDEQFQTPLRKLPDDLIKVRPADFGLDASMLVGKVDRGFLVPYGTRQDIEQQNSDDETLIWLNDPIEKYFLQVQGSGNVRLENGGIIHVVYAGNNGYEYVSIGQILSDMNELDEASAQSIKQWLADNPEKQQWLFNQNPRYIFFAQSGLGAITSQGVPATANRTLAVDPEYVPLGLPVWVETTLTANNTPYRQLMVAQDTGNAIKGQGRGDLYLGLGDEAGQLAGRQYALGKMYVLVPRQQKTTP